MGKKRTVPVGKAAVTKTQSSSSSSSDDSSSDEEISHLRKSINSKESAPRLPKSVLQAKTESTQVAEKSSSSENEKEVRKPNPVGNGLSIKNNGNLEESKRK